MPRKPEPDEALPDKVVAAQHGELLRDVLEGGASEIAQASELTPKQRQAVVDQFLALLEGLYTHLPLKKAMYGVDPLQRLRLLRHNVEQLDDLGFHRQMAAIVTDLRDAHTRYVGPSRLEGRAAMLPFLVEMYGAPPAARYVVSRVADTAELIGDEHFTAGVELTFWNGMPIDRAVELYAEQETGGRPDSRRARAVDTLTFRSLQFGPPPDEYWVDVGYRGDDDVDREVRIPWRVVAPEQAAASGLGQADSADAPDAARHGHEGNAAYLAIDPAREATRRTKTLMFAPKVWLADQEGGRELPAADRPTKHKPGELVPTTLPHALACKTVETSSGVFGVLRLWSFDVADDVAYVEEVVRLLAEVPPEGLILDLRGNPGGLIWAAERLLQLFGPQRIAPTRFSLLATELTRAMARRHEAEFAPWLDSLEASVPMGEQYSQSVPITPAERCNDIGQVYSGPVVAVVDANTYSAGDLFAAGFIDNELGTLVTVGAATGAGGANVWAQDAVLGALSDTDFTQKRLPQGITYTISIRRATRGCGPSEGAPIEDVGVSGHETYAMTRADLLRGNEDMLDFCAKLLVAQERTLLDVKRLRANARTMSVTTEGLDRLDFYVNGKPDGFVALDQDGVTKRKLPAGWERVEVQGFKGDRLRQRRLLEPV